MNELGDLEPHEQTPRRIDRRARRAIDEQPADLLHEHKPAIDHRDQ